MRSATSARRGVLAVAILCAVLFASAGAAEAAPAPRAALQQALREVHALAPPASPGAGAGAAAAAAGALARATNPNLWIDPGEGDAPPYGANIFDASAQAVRDLELLSGQASGRTGALRLIAAAERALAEGVIAEATGGDGALLLAARSSLGAGVRAARSGRFAPAVQAYAAAWKQAYRALTGLVAADVTTVPATALAAAAEQALSHTQFGMAGPETEQGLPPLSAGGKPEVFYAGSEACPFCGVQRWGMIVALSQFGTFSNLHLMQSGTMLPPQVRTFTFFGSSYQSPYISFIPVEVWSNVPKGSGIARLQPLTAPENALLHKFDPSSQTPFIDVANRFITVDSTVDPRLIAHMSWTQIADALTEPSIISTQAIAGEAEVFTAELCQATGGNPQAVCSSAVVQQYEAALPTLTGQGGSCPAPPGPGGAPAGDAAAGITPAPLAVPVATAARRCGD